MSRTTTPEMTTPVDNGRLPLAIGVTLFAIAAMAICYLPIFGEHEGTGTGGFAIASSVAIVTAAMIFGPVFSRAADVPGAERRTASWLAGLSAVTVAIFWMVPPFVLGPAAVALGRKTGHTAAVVVGAGATLVASAALIFGLW